MRTKFDDAWVKASRAKGDRFSYPADKPMKRIDHIFYSKGVRAKKAWVVATSLRIIFQWLLIWRLDKNGVYIYAERYSRYERERGTCAYPDACV